MFHDKRLSDEGKWLPSEAEKYYAAEAALLLAHKWSRPEIVEKILGEYGAYGDAVTSRAKAEFQARRLSGRLPAPRDAEHKVGQFIDGMYARHRYAL
jgi:hypothetical protein